MAPSVSTGDGGRNVAGEYPVADSISPRRLTGVCGLVLQPDPEKACCLGAGNRLGTPSKRGGSGFEREVVKVPQAMLPAKPATDPDSGIFTASMA